MSKRLDLTGQKFGYLTAIEIDQTVKTEEQTGNVYVNVGTIQQFQHTGYWQEKPYPADADGTKRKTKHTE